MSGRRAIALVLVALIVVGASACADDGVADVSGDTPTTLLTGPPPAATAGADFEPRFSAAVCPDGVPRSARVRCGWLVVREDRSRPEGPTVRLPVAIVRGSAPRPSADPVLYLSGGPGQSGLAAVAGFLDEGYVGERDVILFDQRGTGSALPSLDCPEVADATLANFATADAPAAERAVQAAGFTACHQRLLGDSVDLAAYRTETSADDVDDLRTVLGYEQVNLFGASYGTAVALATMRRHPEGLRSVVLDSVYPTTIPNGPAEVAANARRAVDALAAACAAAEECVADSPDLAGAVDRVVARFDAEPHPTSFVDAKTGETIPALITGADVLAGVVQAFYNPATIKLLPTAIAQLEAGDTSGIDAVVGRGVTALTGLSEGMAASVECADRAALPSKQTFEAVVEADPAMATLALVADFATTCAAWSVPPASDELARPVSSDIPTLVLGGGLDPVTPPSNIAVAVQGLSEARTVSFPTLGHGVVFTSPCAAGVMQEFLATPNESPDAACATVPPGPWG